MKQRKDLTGNQKSIAKELIKKHTSLSTKDLNIRTFEKLLAIIKYKPNKADYLFSEIIEVNEDKEAVWRLIQSQKPVSEQVADFVNERGRSRRYFFKLKKELVHECTKSGGIKTEKYLNKAKNIIDEKKVNNG